ncbi:MAG: hypothetical protein ACYC09_11235 [Bacteroidota bacterium]
MKNVFIILIGALYFYGCDDNPVIIDSNKDTDILMPLAIGNTWIYARDFLDSNGVVKETNYDTTTITRDTLINNVKWYAYGNSGSYASNASDGLYIYDTIRNTPICLFQYPASINDSTLIDASNKQYCKLISTSDPVIISGKKYRAYTYKWYHQEPIDDYRLWVDYFIIVPNIGFVSSENIVIDRITGNKYFWQKTNLLSFNIK